MTIMSIHLPTRTRLPAATAVIVGLCLSLVGAGGTTPALAQPDAGQGEDLFADDPFADELNPFGPSQPGPPTPRPAEPPGQPPGQPAPPLPVPFPEATVPGAAAARPTMPERGSWEPSPAEGLLAEAEKLDQAGKLEEARSKLREAIAKDPKLPIAYLALGVVSRRLGDFEGSVDALSKGLLLDPQDSEMYLRRGIAWFHLGLYGIALEDFEEAAGIAYDDPRPELWRGLTLIELDRPLEAINAYASSIRRDRTFMLAYLNRGLAYLVAGQPSKAEFDFDQAIRHDPDDVRAWFNRGVALGRQGRFAEAANSYAEALKRDPKHEPSRRNLAAIRSRTGR
jgi:tetratricopeptide (TPR) repeat protein